MARRKKPRADRKKSNFFNDPLQRVRLASAKPWPKLPRLVIRFKTRYGGSLKIIIETQTVLS